MASGDIDVTVSMEAVMHQELRSLAEGILAKYGVMILAVNFDWTAVRQIGVTGLQESTLESVTMETRT